MKSPTILLVFLLFATGCDKVKSNEVLNPVEFSGISKIQPSGIGRFILVWDAPELVQVENYEIYLLTIADEDPSSDTRIQQTQESEVQDSTNNTGPQAEGIEVDVALEDSPFVKGKLLGVVPASETTFQTGTLEEGSYGFQVKVLTSDGRRDDANRMRIAKVDASIGFQGIQLAEVEERTVKLKWLPYPFIKSGENYKYTIYKGNAFNEAVGFTQETEYSFELGDESEGDIIYFGVRYTNGEGVEETNDTILPITVPLESNNYLGCVSARGLGSDRIEITFEWPSDRYDQMTVLRGETEAFVTQDRNVTTFVDIGLQEAESYTYTCRASFGKDLLIGNNALSASTISTNAPTFSGLTDALYLDAHTARISWGVATGVPAKAFHIFSNPGSQVDWSAEPIAKIEPSVLTYKIDGLGDQLTYSFGVRACTEATCDQNTEQWSGTSADDGAPLTVGAESAALVNGKIIIKAPWDHPQGGIGNRLLYVKEGGEAVKDISLYTLSKTIVVDDATSPPQEITFDEIETNKTYHLIVRDTDAPHLNDNTKPLAKNQNLNVVTIVAGDLEPPNFSSLSDLKTGPAGKEDTSFVVEFTALPSILQNPGDGVANYRIYILEGAGNACSEEYYNASVDAKQFAPGAATLTIENLTPRTIYSICLQAEDQSGNISTATNFLTKQTLDNTAPNFDGIQTFTFNKDSGLMSISWNPSPSPDILEYKLDVWVTEDGMGDPIFISFKRSHAEFPTGFSFNNELVPFNSEDVVEIAVNACDDASNISGGTQNCTTYGLADALKIILDDVEPPPGFIGIGAEPDQLTPVEGRVEVSWIAPADWTDYAGFRVYTVEEDGETLTFRADCACAPDCLTEKLTQCAVTGLDDFRTYTFHVRAYDDSGNLTILDPTSASTSKRTLDSTPPTFIPNLTLTYLDGVSSLSWSTATDNQYQLEPEAKISYKIFRKTGSNFANLLDPAADGTLLDEIASFNYDDSRDYASGVTYYYIVCAYDGAENQSCDGSFASIQTPDLVKPVISDFTTSKSTEDKLWTIDWSASDNTTANPNLLFRVRKQSSNSADTVVDPTATVIFTANGATQATNLQGPKNQDVYVHYLLQVIDEAGNVGERQLTVFSQNLVTVDSIKSEEGSINGGELLIVKGSGFHSSSTVTVGAKPCINTQLVSKSYLTCEAPDQAEGLYNVKVENQDLSSDTLTSAYSYCTPDVNCKNVCNNPGSWEDGANFALETGRGGNSENPFIICTGTHLNNIRKKALNLYYEIGANIDLSAFVANSFTPLTNDGTGFRGRVYGEGYAIANYSYNNSGQDVIGLFRRVYGNSLIENLGLVNFNLVGRDYVGSLAGSFDYDYNTIVDNIFATGTIQGRERVGGVTGYQGGKAFNIDGNAVVTGRRYVGGLFGLKYWAGGNYNFRGSVTATQTGTGNQCQVGGLVGAWDGDYSIVEGFSATDVTVTCVRNGRDTYNAGGLFGWMRELTVRDATFDGTVAGDSQTGGIFGEVYTTNIENSICNGSITGHRRVGGCIGRLGGNSNLTNLVANETTVVGTAGLEVGGIIGYAECGPTSRCTIDKSSSSGTVTSVNSDVGGLAGRINYTDITNSSSSVTVVSTGGWAHGGLIGNLFRSTIDGSSATGTVTATGRNHVGGLIGHVYYHNEGATITNSFATGDVAGHYNVGGLVGTFRGNLSDSYASGDVAGDSRVGGLIGYASRPTDTGAITVIEDSFATGNIEAANNEIGGFIGFLENSVDIRRSYAEGDVTGDNDVGGFIGYLREQPANLEQNFARGNVSGNVRIGGFLGHGPIYRAAIVVTNNYATGRAKGNLDVGGFAGASASYIFNSYAVGKVEKDATEANFGGFIGRFVSNGPQTAPGCFWDTQTTGQDISDGGEGKITLEMQNSATFLAEGWDTMIWNLQIGQYPSFQWEAGP